MELSPDIILFIQLVVSFFAGGTLIALLTFAAEKAGSRASGIILAIPSTAALGFFFMGWVVSPDEVATIVPGTLIPLGFCILFPLAYIYSAAVFARITGSKWLQIFLSFLTASSIWLLLAIPLVIYRVNDPLISIPVYLLMVWVAHELMNRGLTDKPPSAVYTVRQKILRAFFVGLFIMFVVFLGKTLDPLWGGAMAMFPVAFSSSLMVMHAQYEPHYLYPAARRIPVGSLSIFVYNITVMLVFPVAGFILGTLIAYITSLATTLIILKLSGSPAQNSKHEKK